MSPFLDLYDPLDVIGNGSFGIIRKVRRKSDGLIFARKELNFERMSERDRKQIVAEVNILKDLHHEHIVGYHDRYVDRDAGILYILMEYCGGGDLSGVIKQAGKQNRPIAEDTIWNYFMQILLALHQCHHPNGHGRSSSGSGSSLTDGEGTTSSRRPQILHRDLKPDNVFLDENNNVKLGDFGLSKALPQASFASTYVGTPYYMSPELMQEKAYDSKSDIWSLGCLIYELCALKPPFHEAKTHSELSILIRNGRIPPLPRGYSQSLFGVIKAMLNLNPAMRPSAAQLLQHERLELVFRVSETEKMLSQLKTHKNTIVHREREVAHREQLVIRKEQEFQTLLARKDQDIAHLQQLVAQLQQQQQQQQHASQPAATQHEIHTAVKHAVARREEELRILVMKREEEVATAITKREEEIMGAVRKREAEVCDAWVKREGEIRQEVEASIRAVEERVQWIARREAELRDEEGRLEEVREEVEGRVRRFEEQMATAAATAAITATTAKGHATKTPLEEVKNTLGGPNMTRRLHETLTSNRRSKTQEQQQQQQQQQDSQATPKPSSTQHAFPSVLETPITRPSYTDSLPSAMKGVVLTTTGEVLATPNPAELSNLFNSSPKVGLNFAKIFDFAAENRERSGGSGGGRGSGGSESGSEGGSPPVSPTLRKEVERRAAAFREKTPPTTTTSEESENPTIVVSGASSSSAAGAGAGGGASGGGVLPTRIRRPSIRSGHRRGSSIPTSASLDFVPTTPALFPPSAATPSSGSSSSPSGSVPSSSSSSSATSSSSSSSSSATTTTSSASSAASTAATSVHPKPLPHPHLPSITRSTSVPSVLVAVPTPPSPPEYDFSDQENLPSPFLKKVDSSLRKGGGGGGLGVGSGSSSSSSSRGSSSNAGPSSTSSSASGSSSSTIGAASGTSTGAGGSLRVTKKRPSTGNLLRAVAAANNVGRARKGSVGGEVVGVGGASAADGGGGVSSRLVLGSARRAGEEARKALSRP